MSDDETDADDPLEEINIDADVKDMDPDVRRMVLAVIAQWLGLEAEAKLLFHRSLSGLEASINDRVISLEDVVEGQDDG